MNEYGLVLKNANLEKLNTYNIKAKVKYLIYPKENKIADLINYLNNKQIKYFILGGGSNIILANE